MHYFFSRGLALWTTAALAPLLLLGGAAQAHHLMDINGLTPTAVNGFLAGLAHPVLGPDHLLFLLALSLVGMKQRGRWMLALLAVGLLGSAAGLVWPGLPGAEIVLALTLGLEALTLLGYLPDLWLLPAMALHGYVLSAAVLGWSSTPVGTYLLGLLLSQGLLLLLALTLLQRTAQGLGRRWRALAAIVLLTLGGVLALGQALA